MTRADPTGRARVLVIGGGAAGVAAALAARHAGATVTVVRQALGATALSSGAVDLAAASTEKATDAWRNRRSVAQAYVEQSHATPQHPLSLAAVDPAAAEQTLRALCEALPLLQFRPLGLPPLVIPTDQGTFKSTTLCQPGALAGDLPALDGARVGVFGIKSYPVWPADALAASFAHHAARGGIALETVPLEVALLQRSGEELMHPHELARRFERDAASGRCVGAMEKLARRHRLDALFLPPVLGLDGHRQVMRRLEETGVKAAEMLASPPSVPGLRLHRQLQQALEREGITEVNGAVVGYRAAGDRLAAVQLQRGDPLSADAFVLATGKFIGRGLVHDRRLREPIFDLPVWIDADGPGPRYLGGQMSRAVQGPHPLMRAGLRVDSKLRPLGPDQRPRWSNLHGGGSILGGYDYITGRCGLGTALITGWLAGAAASGLTAGSALSGFEGEKR